MPLVERYDITRHAHIERRADSLTQQCDVIYTITGRVHSQHSTMEGAKHALNRLTNYLVLLHRQLPPKIGGAS